VEARFGDDDVIGAFAFLEGDFFRRVFFRWSLAFECGLGKGGRVGDCGKSNICTKILPGLLSLLSG
jgi:hypothetical protein